jgi:hypothetical protein
MEAGLTKHIWDMDEVVALVPKPVIGPSLKDRDILLSALAKLELS